MFSMDESSKISKFYDKSQDERISLVKNFGNLSHEQVLLLKEMKPLNFETANRMIENVIGVFPFPFAVATNFKVNGKDYLIPMALEEPSVVAAASNAAKLSSGFKAESTAPIMIGQIQLVNVKNFDQAKKKILENKKALLNECNGADSILVKLGGGAKDLEVKELDTERGKMFLVQLLVDVRDAMGANAVNTMSERISSKLEELSGGETRLRIVSNLAVHRTSKASTTWKKEVLGEEAIERILDAYAFAAADKFRCCTHNKGIMNGIDAVVVATGNDFRAVEAGAHTYASLSGSYKPLTKYFKDKEGNLAGEIELPLAVGIIGGATRTHPIAQISLQLLKVNSAQELSGIIASVGLAQNFAALRALATEGIQKGHMRLHSKNIAVTANVPKELIDEVSRKMIEENKINVSRAKEILEEMQKK